VLTHWKEREGAYRSRRARITRELGHVPAYATTEAGAPEDVEPAPKRRRTRRGSLIAPEEAGAPISQDEFQELVRDLDVEEQGAATDRSTASTKVAAADARPVEGEPEQPAAPAPPRDPAADLAPEDLVLKDAPKQLPNAGARRARANGANTGGALMGMLAG